MYTFTCTLHFLLIKQNVAFIYNKEINTCSVHVICIFNSLFAGLSE